MSAAFNRQIRGSYPLFSDYLPEALNIGFDPLTAPEQIAEALPTDRIEKVPHLRFLH